LNKTTNICQNTVDSDFLTETQKLEASRWQCYYR